MGKLFSIDAATKAVITDALDDIITEFGKECRLVYPARWTRCDNCLWDAASQKSTNRWRTGGPMPFRIGTCPLCKGSGQRAEEISEVVTMKVEWEPANFWIPVPNLNIRGKHSVCQTKYLADVVAKVERCDHMVVQVPIEGLVLARMTLTSQPVSPGNIIQNRYWVSTWESRG